MPTIPVHSKALSGELVDPYGVAAGTQPNLKRLLAKRLLGRQKFTPRGGQYPHTQGLADLAETGLGLYAHHLANQEGYAKDDRIAQALIGQIRGGGIGQADMPQRQPRVIPAEPTDRSEMEPDPNLPSMERMPPPQQTSGFDTSQYDSLLQPGPKGHYNLPGVRMAHQQFLGDRREYKQNIKADRIRKEDQIIAAQNKLYDREIAEKKYRQGERKYEAAQLLGQQRLSVSQERLEKAKASLLLQKQNFQRGVKKDAEIVSQHAITNSRSADEFGAKVNKTYIGLTQEFLEIRRNFNVLTKNLKLNTGEGDFFALQSLFQMVEPSGRGMTSVGQMQEAYNARAIPEKIAMFFKQFLENDKLGGPQRRQLMKVGGNIHGTEMREAKMYQKIYRDVLTDSGMFKGKPDRINRLIPDLTTMKMETITEKEYGDEGLNLPGGLPSLTGTGERPGVNLPLEKVQDSGLIQPTSPERKVPEGLQSIANAWDVDQITEFDGRLYKVVVEKGKKVFKEVFGK